MCGPRPSHSLSVRSKPLPSYHRQCGLATSASVLKEKGCATPAASALPGNYYCQRIARDLLARCQRVASASPPAHCQRIATVALPVHSQWVASALPVGRQCIARGLPVHCKRTAGALQVHCQCMVGGDASAGAYWQETGLTERAVGRPPTHLESLWSSTALRPTPVVKHLAVRDAFSPAATAAQT